MFPSESQLLFQNFGRIYKLRYYKNGRKTTDILYVWNILFMAPTIKLIVVFFTYFGASFETNATFRSVAYRSWSRIGSCL